MEMKTQAGARLGKSVLSPGPSDKGLPAGREGSRGIAGEMLGGEGRGEMRSGRYWWVEWGPVREVTSKSAILYKPERVMNYPV